MLKTLSQHQEFAKAYLEQRLPKRTKSADIFRHKTSLILDEYFFKAAKVLNPDVCFEFGAHEASASVRFLHQGGKKAVAVEANPHVFQSKTEKAKKHGVVTLNFGLGESEGQSTFFAAQNDILAGNSSFLKKQEGEFIPIQVMMTTVDKVVQQQAPIDSFCIWLDVEGYTAQVLDGAKQALLSKSCLFLKLELEEVAYWKNQSLAPEIDQTLSDLGYSIFLRDIEYARQFNLIYLRNELFINLEGLQTEAIDKMKNIKLSLREKFFPRSVQKMDFT